MEADTYISKWYVDKNGYYIPFKTKQGDAILQINIFLYTKNKIIPCNMQKKVL